MSFCQGSVLNFLRVAIRKSRNTLFDENIWFISPSVADLVALADGDFFCDFCDGAGAD